MFGFCSDSMLIAFLQFTNHLPFFWLNTFYLSVYNNSLGFSFWHTSPMGVSQKALQAILFRLLSDLSRICFFQNLDHWSLDIASLELQLMIRQASKEVGFQSQFLKPWLCQGNIKGKDVGHISTLGNLCAVLLRMFDTFGGYNHNIEGFLVPLGRIPSVLWKCSVLWSLFRTVEGYHQYIGGC